MNPTPTDRPYLYRDDRGGKTPWFEWTCPLGCGFVVSWLQCSSPTEVAVEITDHLTRGGIVHAATARAKVTA
jgi:hypothetical protein